MSIMLKNSVLDFSTISPSFRMLKLSVQLMDLEAFSPCLGKARNLEPRILGSRILFLSPKYKPL